MQEKRQGIMRVLRDYWNNCDLRKKGFNWASGITSFGFTVLPESVFYFNAFALNLPSKKIILVNRIMIAILVYVLTSVVIMLWMYYRRKIVISGRNYRIKIEYGDIFKMKKCKKVIAFDESFMIKVGDRPEDIYPTSICGKFLQTCSDFNEDVLQKCIQDAKLSPLTTPSNFNKTHYKPGSIAPYNEYLLLAFVPLNEDGIGVMPYEQYLACLSFLWKEIDKYHAGEDVCIPILGSGSATHIGDRRLMKQDLLDVIIASYKLSADKLQTPCTLHIVCKPDDDFSLNQIGKFI